MNHKYNNPRSRKKKLHKNKKIKCTELLDGGKNERINKRKEEN